MLEVSGSILSHFSSIKDPRINRQKLHKLENIFFITICAVICGADNWVAVEEFGEAKEEWFTKILSLEHGIPSHDTFGKVFAALDTEHFADCFSRWISDLCTLSDGEIIAIDGKRIRRSLDKASNKSAIHMVSAWAHQNRLVLGQVKVDDKSNEITAIPKLLEKLNITGAVVTLDAMGCQRSIAEQIISQGGDYVFSLKGNQGDLYDDIKQWFETHDHKDRAYTDVDGGHGRVETRHIKATTNISWLQERHNWPHLGSILAVTATRELANKVSTETRYFISSIQSDDSKRLGQAVRAHWAIENELHWTLDVAFNEDQSRTRNGNSAANMAIIRHIALNLAKSEKTSKVGVKTKRLKAGWDNSYLLKILGVG